jgi:hypothetical protein
VATDRYNNYPPPGYFYHHTETWPTMRYMIDEKIRVYVNPVTGEKWAHKEDIYRPTKRQGYIRGDR